MKSHLLLGSCLLVAAMCLAGCERHSHDDGHDHHDHDKGGEQAHGHGHGHGAESPSGASFKPGKGVLVTAETRKIMGLEVVDVADRPIARHIPLTVHVFGEHHRGAQPHEDHAGCDVRGSGLVSTGMAASVTMGLPVQLLRSSNQVFGGVVMAVQKALARGESEVIVGVSNAVTELKPGEFVSARILLPGDEPVAAVPQSAILRTAEDAFVYAVNGDAFFRTAVKTGAEADGWVEITDGLLAGDQVVTKPVQDLWLIELRATKGGGHSH